MSCSKGSQWSASFTAVLTPNTVSSSARRAAEAATGTAGSALALDIINSSKDIAVTVAAGAGAGEEDGERRRLPLDDDDAMPADNIISLAQKKIFMCFFVTTVPAEGAFVDVLLAPVTSRGAAVKASSELAPGPASFGAGAGAGAGVGAGAGRLALSRVEGLLRLLLLIEGGGGEELDTISCSSSMCPTPKNSWNDIMCWNGFGGDFGAGGVVGVAAVAPGGDAVAPAAGVLWLLPTAVAGVA